MGMRGIPLMGRKVFRSGDALLMEVNPKDVIWNSGLAEGDPRVHKPDLWPGQNLMGQVLMSVRAELRRKDGG